MYTYVCLDCIWTSFTFPQFAVQHVSMEYAMLLHSLVTVKTTLKALTAVPPVCISLCVCAYPPSNLLHTLTVCNPPCVNGTCNETTFTCDCMNNFEGSDCSTPSKLYICMNNPSIYLNCNNGYGIGYSYGSCLNWEGLNTDYFGRHPASGTTMNYSIKHAKITCSRTGRLIQGKIIPN